jgi:hypothetical protein
MEPGMLLIALVAHFALALPSAAPAAGETNALVQDQLPQVTFVVPGRRDMPIVLPEDAVLSDDRGTFVFIIDDNDTVVRRDVVTGHVGTGDVGDRDVVIVRGLDGDERVVDRAGAFLNPGERIRPERARATPDAMTAGEATVIANAEIDRALPHMDRSGRPIRTDEADGSWRVTYESADDENAGGPVIVEVDKRTGRAAIVQMPQ